MTLDTAWQLGRDWYHSRLDENWRRKKPEEMQQIFCNIGLTGSFWQLPNRGG